MQDVTKDRDKYIGGSDVPVIMGISPFKTRWELLQEKAGIKAPDFSGNEYTEYGNVMEPKIREYINTVNNTVFLEDKRVNGDIRYHADGYNGETVLEIKSTSQMHDSVEDYKIYLVQLLTGMSEFETNKGLLAVYDRPDDFSEEFDAERLNILYVRAEDFTDLRNEVYTAIDKFRCDLSKLKINPFITEEELQPNEVIELSNQVIALENGLAQYKQIEAECKAAKSKLKQAMEEYGIKTWTTPNGTKITLVKDEESKKVWEFDKDKFAEENAELYTKYLAEKIKKGKAGFVKITLPKEK